VQTSISSGSRYSKRAAHGKMLFGGLRC
jgi:hypothetical protein